MSVEPRPSVVVEMMSSAAAALHEGRPPGHAIAQVLGEAMDADVAAWVAVDDDETAEVIGAWPHADVAERLASHVASRGWPVPSPQPVRAQGSESTKTMILAPQPIEGVTSVPGRRVLLLRRGRGFGAEAETLAVSALPGLRFLLNQVVAASERQRQQERRRIQAVRFGLTERELQVLDLLVQGMLATSIAARLDLSPRTVHKHLGNIYEKLGVHDRLVAASLARRYGLVNDSPFE